MSRVSRGLQQRLVHGLGSSSAPERRIRNDTSAWSEVLGAWRTQGLPERSPLAERGRGSLAPTSQTRKPRLRHGRPFARRRTAGQSLGECLSALLQLWRVPPCFFCPWECPGVSPWPSGSDSLSLPGGPVCFSSSTPGLLPPPRMAAALPARFGSGEAEGGRPGTQPRPDPGAATWDPPLRPTAQDSVVPDSRRRIQDGKGGVRGRMLKEGSGRFGLSPSAASLSTCSWGPRTHPSPDVFFGAGCVFTRCPPASPNSTVTSLWAQVSAVDLLSVDGGLLSQKPGARARAGAPFSGVDHLCIGSGIILSGALFPFPVSRDRACVSVLVLFPERCLAFRRRAGCNRMRVGFE
ncbi:uncharacterized protein LOC115502136 [Lynx canadensis]|uniref:uncharacterized protein LOC115502136 n=1 Tax=Lynx canadensis TaxID=61383 RepID=UPI0011AFFE37|nr:uncharacterized protein LOC115502136 [Lynx canadensis]